VATKKKTNEGWLEGAGAGFLIGLGMGHPTAGTVLGAGLGAFISAVTKIRGLEKVKKDPKYHIYINGKQYDGSLRPAWDAANLIADLAAKEHDIKTQFTIVDSASDNVVFRKVWEPEKADWKDTWHDDSIVPSSSSATDTKSSTNTTAQSISKTSPEQSVKQDPSTNINSELYKRLAARKAGKKTNEEWSKKYKDSINCSNPKGFSQKAHCAGKKKNEDMNENIPFNECPKCRGPIVHESMMTEKQDACYHKVKSRYKVWPSAYASGALVQCRKKGASNWGTGGKKDESSIMKGIVDEAKAKQYVKPYNNPQTGEQIGWVSSDGYHKKYWQKFAKDSAIKHAKLDPEQVDEACWKGYHKEGNKKMFGKTYPNCVKNTNEDLSQADVDGVARFADKLYKKLGIDVTFTKHFMDRVNDKRNGKPISGAELVRLFKKEYERWGKDVAQMGPDMEGTFKDLTTDINLPFVLRWDRDEEELDLVAKTVMRKKNFKTDNQEFPVDESEEQLDEKCWDTHKQVGMKNKSGRQVPNCVPKESAILKGFKSL
jgi:hypothetical protein